MTEFDFELHCPQCGPNKQAKLKLMLDGSITITCQNCKFILTYEETEHSKLQAIDPQYKKSGTFF